MPSSDGDVREYVAVDGCLRALSAAVLGEQVGTLMGVYNEQVEELT